MLPLKGIADNEKATHVQADVDIVTLSEKKCYYCKQYQCVCDGTPFKNSTPRSETPQSKVEQGTTDAH